LHFILLITHKSPLPKFSCEECRRQFVENPSNEMIPQEAWNLAGRLLLEEISAQESQEPRKHGLSNMNLSQNKLE
jgi:hypothetical protein